MLESFLAAGNQIHVSALNIGPDKIDRVKTFVSDPRIECFRRYGDFFIESTPGIVLQIKRFARGNASSRFLTKEFITRLRSYAGASWAEGAGGRY
jgi:hypothetical protein